MRAHDEKPAADETRDEHRQGPLLEWDVEIGERDVAAQHQIEWALRSSIAEIILVELDARPERIAETPQTVHGLEGSGEPFTW